MEELKDKKIKVKVQRSVLHIPIAVVCILAGLDLAIIEGTTVFEVYPGIVLIFMGVLSLTSVPKITVSFEKDNEEKK
ncbi:MAG: hypothetical protein IJ759_07410 [Bacteroidales bacterium]|nr:hypothetical protein [Bacteroidales bacterium]